MKEQGAERYMWCETVLKTHRMLHFGIWFMDMCAILSKSVKNARGPGSDGLGEGGREGLPAWATLGVPAPVMLISFFFIVLKK